jgi:hypothetical protein
MCTISQSHLIIVSFSVDHPLELMFQKKLWEILSQKNGGMLIEVRDLFVKEMTSVKKRFYTTHVC